MVRLSTELLARAEERINSLGDRELNLRSLGIQTIENLGAANDQFQSIDFCNNEIHELSGFPLMKRVRSLLLSQNHISSISSHFCKSVPFLTTLMLDHNELKSLDDITRLAPLTRLETLVLIGNPVSFLPDYRAHCIQTLPSLQVLDFTRVKLKERKAVQSGAPLVSPAAAKVGAPTVSVEDKRRAMEKAILNAKTKEEVARLESMLSLGIIPEDIGRQEEEQGPERKRTRS